MPSRRELIGHRPRERRNLRRERRRGAGRSGRAGAGHRRPDGRRCRAGYRVSRRPTTISRRASASRPPARSACRTPPTPARPAGENPRIWMADQGISCVFVEAAVQPRLSSTRCSREPAVPASASSNRSGAMLDHRCRPLRRRCWKRVARLVPRRASPRLNRNQPLRRCPAAQGAPRGQAAAPKAPAVAITPHRLPRTRLDGCPYARDGGTGPRGRAAGGP